MTKIRNREYQNRALRHAMQRRGAWAGYMDMRLGKTRVAIQRVKLSTATLVLVVAPYSALAGWQDQLYGAGENRQFLLTGSAAQRKACLDDAVEHSSSVPGRGRAWCLINKEGHRVIPQLRARHFDAVILDEATFIKSPKSAVSRYYVDNFRSAILRIILTGTPAPESELEYLQQLRFLHHRLLPGNYYETRMQWFALPRDRPDSHVWRITRHGKRQLAQALNRVAFFLSRRDVNLGGEKMYRTRTVRLCKKARAAYGLVEEQFVLNIDDVDESTIWATQRFLWMRRITGGSLPREEGPPLPVDEAKVQALGELLSGELVRERVVVWAVFHAELEHIYDVLLRQHGIDGAIISGKVPHHQREWAREQFNLGKKRVLICQPEVFRHGVDLGEADTMIYYSTPCGLETRLQTEDRIVRVGKERSLLILDLVAEDTVDEDILAALRAKHRREQMMRTIVKQAAKRRSLCRA